MKKINQSIIRALLLWSVFGILFAGSVMAMWHSHSLNLLDFYDTGKIFRMKTDDLNTMKLHGLSYDEKSGILTVDSADAKITFAGAKSAAQFYYLYLDVEELNTEYVIFKFGCYDKNGNRVSDQQDMFGEGSNLYTIPINGEFTALKLFFQGQQGVSFKLNHVELREQPNMISAKRYVILTAGAFAIYVLVSVLFYLIGKKYLRRYQNRFIKFINWGKNKIADVLECLQFLFLLEEKPAQWLSTHLNDKCKSRLRVGLLTGLCFYMNLMNLSGMYDDRNYYKYHILLASIIIILLGWLLYDGRIVYRIWKNDMVCSWFILCLTVCLSDAVMGSQFLATGYVWLFAFGSLYFFWANQEVGRERFIREVFCGIGIYLMVALTGWIICLIASGGSIISVPTPSALMISWKSYLSEMNLIGHSTEAGNSGRGINAYNTFLTWMYRYGVFSVLPYLFMICVYLQKTCSLWKKDKSRYGKVLFGIGILYVIMMFCSNQENPFLSPLWIMMYIFIGYFF